MILSELISDQLFTVDLQKAIPLFKLVRNWLDFLVYEYFMNYDLRENLLCGTLF